MYAHVVFPLALPSPLTYAVPSQLEGLVQRGVRVRAPLRGRLRIGLVVGLVAEAEVATDRVLPLGDVLEGEPLLPLHLFELMEFAAAYYAAPLGVVARAAVPAPLLTAPPPLLVVGPRAVEMLGQVGGEELRLLQRLVAVRRISVPRLWAEGWNRLQLGVLLEQLVSRQAVRVVERPVGTAGGRVVPALALSEAATRAWPVAAVQGPAQRRVLEWLHQEGRVVLESEALAACHCSRSVITALAAAGWVRRFQQERPRQVPRWEMAALDPPAALSASQRAAVAAVEARLGGGRFCASLLFGVTGSGKTEVYLRLAVAARERGLETLVLVPEIALTPALAGQLSARFGERVAVVHSAMPEGDRAAIFDRVRRGGVDVVVGPRSALWAPLGRLGLVVVDEEHDPSYKQGEEPRYNARDLALVLGQICKVPVVLASATPSMEALRLGRSGRLEVLQLPERVGGGTLPQVEVVDLSRERPEKGEHGRVIFSERLQELLAETVGRRQQAILLVNRRGWAPVLLCRMCGQHAACPHCSIPMTVHRRQRSLQCHYCGHQTAIPTSCPRCNGEVLDDVGVGTEKVAEKVAHLLPQVRVGILDRDTARSPLRLLTTLESFATGGMDVLVGTQMVAKGHHFPRVTLIGVVAADNLLGFPDFRGAERTFQLLTQVAGRAGRGEAPGRVVFQSYHPDHHAVSCAARHDVAGFAKVELAYRQAFRYPPFARLALIRWEAAQEAAARGAGERAAAQLDSAATGVRLVGPSLAPIARLRGKWRVQLLLFAARRPELRQAVEEVAAMPLPRGVHRVIDVDPQSTV